MLGYDFKSLIDYNIYQDFPTDIIARPCEQIFKILRKKYTNKWIDEKRTNALKVFDYFECVLYNKNNNYPENIDLARNITILVTQMFLESKKEINEIINSVVERFEESILAIKPNI